MSGAREAGPAEGPRTTMRLTERQLWELAAGNDIDLALEAEDGHDPVTIRVGAPPAPCPDADDE